MSSGEPNADDDDAATDAKNEDGDVPPNEKELPFSLAAAAASAVGTIESGSDGCTSYWSDAPRWSTAV